VIDLHSHILPGLDDGARTLDDSRAIARHAAAEGITAIAATPHVRDDWPTSVDRMEAAVARLRADFADAQIPVEVLSGGEIALDRLPMLSPEELDRFSLARSRRYLLVETPYVGWPLGLERTIRELTGSGLTPLLAHPERNGEVHRDLERVARAVAAGALVQVTAASLDGRLGRRTRATSVSLLERGLVHVLASDAHLPEVREAGLGAAAAALRDGGLARYLTEEAPAAIVAGEAIDQPPSWKRRRFRR
jgi:protein-tyrosine phosphatase